jgi:lipoprotein-releasing system permease protein
MNFSLFVAARYLRARRKETVISIITLISVLGVAAGVMALVIALAINNGFRSTLQRALLNATAHVNLEEKDQVASTGISEWRVLLPKLMRVPHVVGVAPVLYDTVMMSGPVQSHFAVIKGIQTEYEPTVSDALSHLKSGKLEDLNRTGGLPSIILGTKLANDTGMMMNANVTVLTSRGTLTPFGPAPSTQRFHVVGLFESGFYEIDDNWAYAPLHSVQRILGLGDVVNSIEMKLDDIFAATQVAQEVERIAGPKYSATTWQDQNKQLLNAFRSERVVTWITIGLIEMVAGLNIFITLVMMVMEKYKDIAVLMSMGARRSQIRNVFMLQGVLIGVAGSMIGLILGYTMCYFANRYRLIPLDETVYALSFVPFESNPLDGLWIAAAAIGVSFVATIYPARKAIRITPVEVLRYE